VIISLQVLGPDGVRLPALDRPDPRLAVTCAVIEFAITFHRQHVIMWPASALLTGNGVAFILRVPGTEHGDWWSMKGWWIFAGHGGGVDPLEARDHVARATTSSIPSNFGLVLCFVLLGATGPTRSPSGGGRCRRGSRWRS
jgi:hypothetical protein